MGKIPREFPQKRLRPTRGVDKYTHGGSTPGKICGDFSPRASLLTNIERPLREDKPPQKNGPKVKKNRVSKKQIWGPRGIKGLCVTPQQFSGKLENPPRSILRLGKTGALILKFL